MTFFDLVERLEKKGFVQSATNLLARDYIVKGDGQKILISNLTKYNTPYLPYPCCNVLPFQEGGRYATAKPGEGNLLPYEVVEDYLKLLEKTQRFIKESNA